MRERERRKERENDRNVGLIGRVKEQARMTTVENDVGKRSIPAMQVNSLIFPENFYLKFNKSQYSIFIKKSQVIEIVSFFFYTL